MKKRLLISSALMTAVLACALGTGTYAWYQAGAAATAVAGTAATGSVGTAVNSYSAGSVTFTPVLALGEDEKPVLTDTQGRTYYYLKNGETKVEDQGVANEKKYGSGKVSVTAALSNASGSATLADVLPELAGKTITVTLSGTNLRFFKTAPSEQNYEGETVSFEHKILSTDTAATIIAETDFYYAITGVDQVQSDSTTYTITATVTIA